MVGHVQVYEEQREPDKYKNYPYDRRYRHHGQSAVRPAGRYAGNNNNVAPR